MLSRLRGQLEDMRSRTQFLRLAKRYLQVSPALRPLLWGPSSRASPRGQRQGARAHVTRTHVAAAGHLHSPQVLHAEQWGLEPCALPMVVNVAAAHCDTLDFSPLDESSSLIFYNVSKDPRASRHQEARVLQAGTPLGLMAYLYSGCVRLGAGGGLGSRPPPAAEPRGPGTDACRGGRGEAAAHPHPQRPAPSLVQKELELWGHL